MNRKLTLSLDSNVVDFAHNFAQKYNKPVSKIVEDYFILLKEQNTTDLPKDFAELHGIFEGINTPDKYEMRKMFHEKYQHIQKLMITKMRLLKFRQAKITLILL